MPTQIEEAHAHLEAAIKLLRDSPVEGLDHAIDRADRARRSLETDLAEEDRVKVPESKPIVEEPVEA